MPWTNGADANIPIVTAYDADGNPTTWSPDFHVNLPCFGYEDADGPVAAFLAAHPELAPYNVEPATLQRIFAGDDAANRTLTVAFKFANEDEAKAVLGPLGYWQPDTE
jgi:hypothetical protein